MSGPVGGEPSVGSSFPSERHGLPAGQIHVWRASLDLPPLPQRELDRWLSADERCRADRFRLDRHRERFITARGLLRALLGAYLRQSPESLRFDYGPHGKPSLGPGCPIRFSLSHADHWVLYAVGVGDVGVDLEPVDRDVAWEAIAARHFSAGERAELRASQEAARAFLAIWTRKEACLKARGAGLSAALPDVDTSAPCGPRGWRPVSGDENDGAWHVRALPAPPRHEGALAARTDASVVRCWDWSA